MNLLCIVTLNCTFEETNGGLKFNTNFQFLTTFENAIKKHIFAAYFDHPDFD